MKHLLIQNAPPVIDWYLERGNAFASTKSQSFNNEVKRIGDKWIYFLWANRSRNIGFNQKGNGPGNHHFFSTVTKANVATRCQLLYLLGKDDKAFSLMRRHGLAWRYAYANNNVTDVVALPEPTSKIDGVMLDYEVQDGRRNPESFLTNIARTIKGAGLDAYFYSNQIDTGSWSTSGLGNSGKFLMNTYDYVSIFSYSRRELSLEYQANKYPGNKSKLFVIHELRGSDIQRARRVKQWVEENNAHGVFIWRNGPLRISEERELDVFKPWLNESEPKPEPAPEPVLTLEQRVKILEKEVAQLKTLVGDV